MPTGASQTISAAEAARLLYRTGQPTPVQVAEVERKIHDGALPGRRLGRRKHVWVTTAGAVASYMAQCSRHAEGQPTRASGHSQRLEGLYAEVMKDYFLAVVLRRRAHQRSGRFRAAVICGQALLLAGVVGLCVLVLVPRADPLSPRRVAVERWIQQHHGPDFTVTRLFPAEPNPHGPGVVVRVQYRYRNGMRRTIETDRRFFMQEGRVVAMDSGE